MKAILYAILVCALVARAHGFVVYNEESLRHRAEIIAEAKSFLDWKFVHPAILAAAIKLPEAQEIQRLPAPKDWKYFNLADPQVRFHSGEWALYYWREGKERRCTVYVPLKSRDSGHGYVAFEFEIEISVTPSGKKKLQSAGELMTGLKFVSRRYLTDHDADFIILD